MYKYFSVFGADNQFKTAMAAANHSKNSAVEADTISKTRASSKSQKSRANFNLFYKCFIATAICGLFASCSHTIVSVGEVLETPHHEVVVELVAMGPSGPYLQVTYKNVDTESMILFDGGQIYTEINGKGYFFDYDIEFDDTPVEAVIGAINPLTSITFPVRFVLSGVPESSELFYIPALCNEKHRVSLGRMDAITKLPSITITNNTGYEVFYVYISPTTSDDWEDDWLGDDEVLSSGNSRTFTLNHPLSVANQYDIRLEDSDGDTYTKLSVTVSNDSRIDFVFEDIDDDDDYDDDYDYSEPWV